MTEQFSLLTKGINDPNGEQEKKNSTYISNALREGGVLGRLICLHQMASTMIDIEKDLRRIETELKKRKV